MSMTHNHTSLLESSRARTSLQDLGAGNFNPKSIVPQRERLHMAGPGGLRLSAMNSLVSGFGGTPTSHFIVVAGLSRPGITCELFINQVSDSRLWLFHGWQAGVEVGPGGGFQNLLELGCWCGVEQGQGLSAPDVRVLLQTEGERGDQAGDGRHGPQARFE